ncbi:Ferrihemoglobin_reductase [Hexamita inflata]|uniref:Ferrihemoglobin reductase n=1 Tax=Hexamita inflata TaxID=28002 RepID=A0AA86P9V9_9EUKA|nr:Ferrihemoglobin reductase [Hexamita inflata]
MEKRYALFKQMENDFKQFIQNKQFITKEDARNNRITPEELMKHNTEDDAWFSYRGYVYDVSPYGQFHPGGLRCFKEYFGFDVTRVVIMKHKHVNIDSFICKLVVGMLDGDPILPQNNRE